jgi:hypothetical protein
VNIVYVFAKDEDEAVRFARGEECYEPWDSLKQAMADWRNPKMHDLGCFRDGDKLFCVEMMVSRIPL